MIYWTKDKKAKLIGTLAVFLMYTTPIVFMNYLQERAERMIGNKVIKAVLKQDINYSDLSGNNKIIKSGEVVDLYVIKAGVTSTDITGRTTVQRESSFIAMKGFDSFDIEADEFKTVD